MPDSNDAETAKAAAATTAAADTTKDVPKKPKPPKRAKSAETAQPTVARGAQARKAGSARRNYSEDERAQKLGAIEKLLAGGRSTVKDAVHKAGITEQTYYQWKKNARSGGSGQKDDLKELVRLEQENIRLRKLLAEQLRSENAELRKRLGLDK
ncbi:transposase [Mesorhizobium sp. SP-1A]|uniref:transposase n=1 Tax=Mesorhizobium sp. SP-1A TaxID=3077840 RepID=UPI0028F731AD|nr:transposase [Mesorhizobium sp. SP-1A]